MKRALLLAAALAAVVCGSAFAISLEPGLEAKFEASFSPSGVSKGEQTPLSLRVAMGFGTVDGSHLPALKEFEIEEDRHARLNLGGVPVCHPPHTDEPSLQVGCRDALIGRGRMNLEIAFPEEPPIFTHAALSAYNGPLAQGARTLYLFTYLTVPTPAVIVSTVTVTKIRESRYGLKLLGSVPRIAGGAGSVDYLALRFRKGVFSATCPDRQLDTRFGSVFVDGSKAAGAVERFCTGVE